MAVTRIPRHVRDAGGIRRASGSERTKRFVSHRWPLSNAPEAYRMRNDESNDCTMFVLDPTR